MTGFFYVTVQPAQPTPKVRKAHALLTMFYIAMVLLVVAVAILIVIRIRTYRRKVSSAIGVEREPARPEEGKIWLDPWSESARRMKMEPTERAEEDDDDEDDDTDDEDTVDIDPSDLGPDDIEPQGPPESPFNGKGRH